jgi:hypothetical protein
LRPLAVTLTLALPLAGRAILLTLRLEAARLVFHFLVRLVINRAVLLAPTGASFLPFVHI